MKKRKQYSPAFKLKVVLEAFKEEKTTSQLSSQFEIHPTLLNGWKREFLENAASVFEDKRKQSVEPEQEKLIETLYRQIGQQKVELDFLERACERLNVKPGKRF